MNDVVFFILQAVISFGSIVLIRFLFPNVLSDGELIILGSGLFGYARTRVLINKISKRNGDYE